MLVIEIITVVASIAAAAISAIDSLLSHVFSDSKIVFSSCCSGNEINK